MTEAEARAALVAASCRTVDLRLNAGTAGNLSLRWQDGMLITPTGIPPEEMRPDQIVAMDGAGNWRGDWRPSTEWAIHLRIYQHTGAGAVVHAHPDHCVALSVLRQPIPPFHYMIASFGGNDVPCARYECFGSAALADAVVEALRPAYSACLMANHGIVATAATLPAALARAEKLEMLARQYLLARAAGAPVMLTPEELKEVRARYPTYGQQRA